MPATNGNDLIFVSTYSTDALLGNDTVFGSDSGDYIYGNGGNDYIYGGRGVDIILGGDGNDAITGDYGDDYLYGGDGDDEIGYSSYHDEVGNDFIDAGNGNDRVYAGSGNDSVYAGTGHDLVQGGDGNDYISGGDGYDTLNGGAGNDWIDGGYGLDVMNGGTGVDTLDVRFWDFGYTVNMTTGLTNYPGETATNFENVYTGAGSDSVIGTVGDNLISTGAGNDRLNGYGTAFNNAAQIDTLYGGDGADTFVLGGSWGVSYVEPGNGYAIIADWNPLEGDRIEVRGSTSNYRLAFGSVSGIGGAAADTEIFDRTSGDRIAIIQDSTNVFLSLDFVSV
jgi:serralysin